MSMLSGCPLLPSGSAAPPSDDAAPKTVAGNPTTDALRSKAAISHSIDKEAVTMPDASGAEPIRGPAIPAIALRKQILDLIGGLRSLQDLERPRIESVLQVKLMEDQERREGFRYDGRTTEGWNYGLSVSRLYGPSAPPVIGVGLDHGVEPWTDQTPTYCTIDFETLAKELVALGYEKDSKRSTLGGKPSWGFGKGVRDTKAGFAITVYLYYLGEEYPAGQACVSSVRISGGTLSE
jgi:hypothetical protein